MHPLKLKDGTLVTDPNEITHAWRVYFEELFTPVDNDKYDNGFKEYVESQINMYKADCNLYVDDILRDKLTIEDVKAAVTSLKNNKAPGWDNITSEYIKNGGPNLCICLLRLYNLMIQQEQIPKHFKIGLMVPRVIRIKLSRTITVVSPLYQLLLRSLKNVLILDLSHGQKLRR